MATTTFFVCPAIPPSFCDLTPQACSSIHSPSSWSLGDSGLALSQKWQGQLSELNHRPGCVAPDTPLLSQRAGSRFWQVSYYHKDGVVCTPHGHRPCFSLLVHMQPATCAALTLLFQLVQQGPKIQIGNAMLLFGRIQIPPLPPCVVVRTVALLITSWSASKRHPAQHLVVDFANGEPVLLKVADEGCTESAEHMCLSRQPEPASHTPTGFPWSRTWGPA
jgi:hypothetical protein